MSLWGELMKVQLLLRVQLIEIHIQKYVTLDVRHTNIFPHSPMSLDIKIKCVKLKLIKCVTTALAEIENTSIP